MRTMNRRTNRVRAGDTPTCGADADDTPIGGNGASAKCSRIFLIPPDCSGGIKLDGTRPSGTAVWLNEQVVSIDIHPKTATEVFGHDKSCGAQDETPGIDSYDGTVNTLVQCCDTPFTLWNGALAWIQVYPLGQDNGDPIEGYARITEAPIRIVFKNGDPVEHNYTYVSKGQWSAPAGLDGYVDCCDDCNCGDSGGDSAVGPADTTLDSDPVTVYKWTDSGVWAMAFDELPEGFVHGPAPDAKAEPGKKAGELKFVKCVKVAPTADLHSHSGLVVAGA